MATSFPKRKIEIDLYERVHPAAVSLFRAERFQVRTDEKAGTGQGLKKRLESVHGVGIRSRTRLSGACLRQSRRLLVVGCYCVGTNNVDLEMATALGIPVFHAPHSSTRSVAELTIGLLLSLARRFVEKSHQARQGKWNKTVEGCHEIRGRTLGIVGYGHIGSQVSVLAESLGMRVVFRDIVDRQPLGNAQPMASLESLLRAADFVTLHVPGGEGTRRMIGARQLRAMKKGACLINTSRGTVVEEAALVAVLSAGRLGGAALDVLEREPASPRAKVSSPLLGFDQVIVTPHVGGNTVEAQRRIAESVTQKMIRFINQGATTGAINFPQVELPRTPQTHRIIHIHRNIPGVLTDVNKILSSLGANVDAQFLQTNEQVGYLVVDLDRTVSGKVMEAMRSLPATLRTRRLF